MKYMLRMLAALFMFTCVENLLALPTPAYIDPATAINISAVASDPSGNFFACVRTGSTIVVNKYNEDGLLFDGTAAQTPAQDPEFGTGGSQTFTVVDGASTATNIGVAGYTGFTASTGFFARCDTNGNLVLAFTVDAAAAGTGIVICIDVNGDLNTSFATDGVFSLGDLDGAATDSTVTLNALTVDSSDRPILVAYVLKTTGDPATRTARVFRVLANGSGLDGAFDTDGQKDLDTVVNAGDATLSDARDGMTVEVDASDNIYVAGKYGPMFYDFAPSGIFCFKLVVADGDLDQTFGDSDGKYVSEHISGINSNQVFLDIKTISLVLTIQIIFSQASTLAVHQLDSDGGFTFAFAEDGVLERDYGLAGLVFPATIDVKGAGRDGEGKLYVTGTVDINDDTNNVMPFLARITTDGALDSDYIFASWPLGLADGVVKVEPTSGETVNLGEGGWMAFYNSGIDKIGFAFEETSPDDANDRLVMMIGDPIDFTVPDSVTEPCILASVGNITYVPPTAGLDQEYPIITSANAVNPDTLKAAIGDAHIVTNVHDEIIYAIRVDTSNQFRVAKFDPRGNYINTFGNTGCGLGYLRVITVGRYASPTITTAVVDKYIEMTENEESYMAFDSTNNIYIAFMVDVDTPTGSEERIVVMKLLDETGALDLAGFNAAAGTGLLVITPPAGTTKLRGLKIDKDGKPVVLAHHDDGGGTKTAMVYRLTAAGVLDATFDTDGLVTLAGSVLDAQVGLSLALDIDGNVFIGGQRGTTGSFQFFKAKLANSNGALVGSFGVAGFFNGGVDTTLQGTHPTYMASYQYDHGGTIVDDVQILSQVVSDGAPAIALYQVDVTGGVLDPRIAGDGKMLIPFPTLTSLDGAVRTEEGHTLISGVLTESGVKYAFQARIHPTESGDILDITHGQDSLGLVKISATPSWQIFSKIPIHLDTGNGLVIGFVECDASDPTNFRLVHMRFLGHAEHYDRAFDTHVAPASGNFDLYLIAHALDTVIELLEYIDFTYGIVPRLLANWTTDAVASSVQTKARGIFVAAVNTAMVHQVSHKALNSVDSYLLTPHKFGDLTGLIETAMIDGLTAGEWTLVQTRTQAAIQEIITGLNRAIERVTGTARQIEETP